MLAIAIGSLIEKEIRDRREDKEREEKRKRKRKVIDD
jgi:hypothetical protein